MECSLPPTGQQQQRAAQGFQPLQQHRNCASLCACVLPSYMLLHPSLALFAAAGQGLHTVLQDSRASQVSQGAGRAAEPAQQQLQKEVSVAAGQLWSLAQCNGAARALVPLLGVAAAGFAVVPATPP